MVASPSPMNGKRKGAASISSVPDDILKQLEAGTIESATLSEGLAINFAILLGNIFPELTQEALSGIEPKLGITKRMSAAAKIILVAKGNEVIPDLSSHTSDTIRGWAAYSIAAQDSSLSEKLNLIKPLADDQHFGVREWAWLAVRPDIVKAPLEAVTLLKPWTEDSSEFIRRFASEALRPRGVWSGHIAAFKSEPALALSILEPLKSDPSRYVQDSVANWLNDAFKSQPEWVANVCADWQAKSATPETAYIVKRALRSQKS